MGDAELLPREFGPISTAWAGKRRPKLCWPHRLRAALEKLNPGVSPNAIEMAVEELTKDRSALSPARANQEVYKLLKDGVKVTYQNGDDDEEAVETVRVIDWNEPGNNDFFLASQFWISGDYGKKRADLIGFVNGIPLVFIELKASHKQLEHAYKNNLSDYKDTIPQVFWYNAFIILSNGSKSQDRQHDGWWEHFAEWKKINDEGEEGVVSLETMIRGTCDKRRLLDLVENFTVFDEAKGETDQAGRQEPPVPRRQQRHRRRAEDQGEPGQARRLLAHAGQRQELLDGLLLAEGAAEAPRQLDIPDRHRPRRPGRPDLPELRQHRSGARRRRSASRPTAAST